jgi:hypothetical protein
MAVILPLLKWMTRSAMQAISAFWVMTALPVPSLRLSN